MIKFYNNKLNAKRRTFLKKKRKINIENLCEDLFQKFAIYFDYIDSLDFDAKSKYFYLRKIFRDLFMRESFDYNHIYD